MKFIVQILVFLSLPASLFFLQSCEKPGTTFPIEPKIAYKSHDLLFENNKYKLKVFLDFTDGDGDLGISEQDTLPPFQGNYYYNFYAKYFEKVNGQFTQLTPLYPLPLGDTIHYNGRLPVLTPGGKQKAIKGEIQYDIDMDIGPLKSNTIKLKIFVYDRALHKSNEIETPEIVFP